MKTCEQCGKVIRYRPVGVYPDGRVKVELAGYQLRDQCYDEPTEWYICEDCL